MQPAPMMTPRVLQINKRYQMLNAKCTGGQCRLHIHMPLHFGGCEAAPEVIEPLRADTQRLPRLDNRYLAGQRGFCKRPQFLAEAPPQQNGCRAEAEA